MLRAKSPGVNMPRLSCPEFLLGYMAEIVMLSCAAEKLDTDSKIGGMGSCNDF